MIVKTVRWKMGDDYSLVKFNTSNFFAILLHSRPFYPISTLLIKVVEAIIQAEQEPDEEVRKRIKWIYENTHDKVNENLAIIELAVFKNLNRGLNREIDIGGVEYSIVELYQYLDEISKELTMIVVDIAKKYALDIPMMNFGGGSGSVTSIDLS